ncbi:MAG: hypothetical protein JO011_16170 [Ktedonobacteraceae bacterium]|nr:hypothetical protein [Ktedonobacteraceae bacterium]
MKRKKLSFFNTTVIVFVCLLSIFLVRNAVQTAAAANVHLSTAATAGKTTTIPGWQILSSAATSDNGASISQPTYSASGWLPVSARSTVLSGLIQNGKYPNVFYSTNLKNVDASQFKVPWWYRENFTIATGSNMHTVLHLDGVNYAADVYLNGHQIATKSQIIGANAANDVDVTPYLQNGNNALALEVQPSDPNKDLAIGWVDWNPAVPDGNMGIWQDVTLHQSGPVSLTNLRVTSTLASNLASADVTVKVDASNNTSSSTTTAVSGTIGSINFSRQVTLAAKTTQTVTFASSDTPALHITNPNVWWPAGRGAHPLYTASLQAAVNGTLSDLASTTFGIRSLTSGVNSSGYRWYKINGENVLIRGGGWAPDMFLRSNPTRLDQEFKVITNMGLNAIRQEGKLETPEFYDDADRYGILLLPGWECCDKWQGSKNFTAAEAAIAQNSMLSVAERIRNHPSVISFLIGSDTAPTAAVAARYQTALQQAEFPDPVVSEAAQGGVAPYGASGMKMNGPYDWVPPNYWYGSQVGASYGFDSETSAGPDVPEIDTLNSIMSAADEKSLWSIFTTAQYHAGAQSGQFGVLKLYDNALAGRYGKPTSLQDYVEKAQLANYENVRSEFESRLARMDRSSNPATGVIFWMMNNAWPSLIWHLFGYDLAPNGSTYGALKANEPVHVLWQYDSNAVTLDNISPATASGLSVTAQTYALNGTLETTQTASNLSVAANHTAAVFTLNTPSGVSGAYLIKLVVKDSSGKEIDRNVYWWSTTTDKLDWANSDWYYTPTTQYADFSRLTSMAKTSVSATASSVVSGGNETTTVKLTNNGSSKVPAFFVEAKLRDSAGNQIAPVYWSDNDVTLWPGESTTLTVNYAAVSGTPQIQISGVNVPASTVSARG